MWVKQINQCHRFVDHPHPPVPIFLKRCYGEEKIPAVAEQSEHTEGETITSLDEAIVQEHEERSMMPWAWVSVCLDEMFGHSFRISRMADIAVWEL